MLCILLQQTKWFVTLPLTYQLRYITLQLIILLIKKKNHLNYFRLVTSLVRVEDSDHIFHGLMFINLTLASAPCRAFHLRKQFTRFCSRLRSSALVSSALSADAPRKKIEQKKKAFLRVTDKNNHLKKFSFYC